MPARRRKPRRKQNFKSKVLSVVRGSQEMKKHEVNDFQTATDVSSTATLTHISDIASGDGWGNRDGNEVYAKYLQLRTILTAADTTNVMRLCVVAWDGGDALTAADIFENTGSGAELVSPYIVKRETPFRVLYDKTFALATTGSTAVRTPKIAINLKGRKIRWDGGNGNSYGPGQLWFLAVSDSGAVTHPTIQADGYLTFYEI